jgi:hypothetical protein
MEKAVLDQGDFQEPQLSEKELLELI